ncbi:hypothetical protein GQ457_08G034040 [Hibiscus cannabinus]
MRGPRCYCTYQSQISDSASEHDLPVKEGVEQDLCGMMVSVVPNDINGNGGVSNEVFVQEKVVPGEAVSETRSQGNLMESVDAVMHCGKYLRPHSSRHRQYWIQTWIL